MRNFKKQTLIAVAAAAALAAAFYAGHAFGRTGTANNAPEISAYIAGIGAAQTKAQENRVFHADRTFVSFSLQQRGSHTKEVRDSVIFINPRKNGADSEQPVDSEKREMTLEDLRTLAAKGDSLLMEDLKNFNGTDVGSGLYILQFEVEGGYTLLVGSAAPRGKPFYAILNVPGFEGSIDIRNDDVGGFILKHPVPDEIKNRVLQYLKSIASEPSPSSATGDYIKANQAEYDAILKMGIPALPALTGILNAGDGSLLGCVAALAVSDIIERETAGTQSKWATGVLQKAESDVLRWSNGV